MRVCMNFEFGYDLSPVYFQLGFENFGKIVKDPPFITFTRESASSTF